MSDLSHIGVGRAGQIAVVAKALPEERKLDFRGR
jgi:hypothetical protein